LFFSKQFRRTTLKRIHQFRGSTIGATIGEIVESVRERNLFELIEKEKLRVNSGTETPPVMNAFTPGVIGQYFDEDGKSLIVTIASVHTLANIVRQQRGATWLSFTDNTKDATYKVSRNRNTKIISSSVHDSDNHAHLVSMSLVVTERRCVVH